MAIVTISRELGAGGDEISWKVADALGYNLVDNALIFQIAERAGVSVEETASYDEKYQSRVVEWLRTFIEPRMGKILTEEGKHLDPETFIEYCKTILRGLAETGNVVIVGRAGQFILNDLETAFHVRVVADEEYRVRRLTQRRGISSDEALDLIHKSDRMRRNYIERYFKANWNDATAYHLVLDTSRLGTVLATKFIVDAVQTFSNSRDYIPGVRDRRRLISRRRAQRRKGERRTSAVGWTSKDMETAVIREGRPVRSLTRPDRRRKDRRIGPRRSTDRI